MIEQRQLHWSKWQTLVGLLGLVAAIVGLKFSFEELEIARSSLLAQRALGAPPQPAAASTATGPSTPALGQDEPTTRSREIPTAPSEQDYSARLVPTQPAQAVSSGVTAPAQKQGWVGPHREPVEIARAPSAAVREAQPPAGIPLDFKHEAQ